MSGDADTQLGLRELLRADWAAITRGSPNPLSYAFPHYFAVAAYRVSHELWRRRRVRLSRVVMLIGQILTGPIVVGSDVRAGSNLILYSGVLLGNYSPARQGQPTLGDRVRVCSKASVLGPVHVGDGVLVGAHALVVDDVPAGATVRAPVAVHA